MQAQALTTIQRLVFAARMFQCMGLATLSLYAGMLLHSAAIQVPSIWALAVGAVGIVYIVTNTTTGKA